MFLRQLPSIEELLGGRSRCTTALINLLNDKFGGSIAPLLLLTREGVLDVEGVGQRRLRIIESHLPRYGLRFRDRQEKVAYRAGKLYMGIDKVPVQALYVFIEHSEAWTFSHYLDSSIIGILSRHVDGLTLGELTRLTRQGVGELITGSGVSIDDRRLNDKLNQLEHRLAGWGLSLTPSNNTVPASTVH